MSHLFNHNGAENTGYSQPAPLACATAPQVPTGLVRKQSARWPRLSEPEMVRHYTWLSKRNFGIDTGFYPLGSCTMKHNPRVNEVIAQLPGIADIHPHQPEHHLQGLLSIFYEMQHMLEVCAGMDQVTLQPVRVHKVNSRPFGAFRSTSATVAKPSEQRSSFPIPPTEQTLPVQRCPDSRL